MGKSPRMEAMISYLGFLGMSLCGLGAVVGMTVVLVRIPLVADTKSELLFGTLQGVAVSLLFAVAALLINLTIMVRRASVRLAVPAGSVKTAAQGHPEF